MKHDHEQGLFWPSEGDQRTGITVTIVQLRVETRKFQRFVVIIIYDMIIHNYTWYRPSMAVSFFRPWEFIKGHPVKIIKKKLKIPNIYGFEMKKVPFYSF